MEIDNHEQKARFGALFKSIMQTILRQRHGRVVVNGLDRETAPLRCDMTWHHTSYCLLLLFEGRLDNADSEGEAEHDTCCNAKATLQVAFELCPEHSKQDAQA